MTPRHRSTRLSRPRLVIGLALIIVAGIGIGYPLWWNHRSSVGSAALLRKDASKLQRTISTHAPGASCTAQPGPGVLQIPNLSLTAPVQQGLTNPVLNISIGHDPSTPWPGPNSAALFAAHDVSFFSHLNLLAPGDIITYTVPCATYTFRVEGSQITSPGAAITVPKTGALVLDTCYPPNALWFTPDRYIVTAQYVSTQPQSASITKTLTATLPVEASLSFPTPPGLSTAQLSLSNNTQDMGQLSFSPTTSSAFQQSDAPLQVEGTALEGWFAVLHSLEANLPTTWHSFAPAVAFPTSLSGQNLQSTSPLEITENIHGSTPLAISLTGGENGHTFTVQESVRHGVVVVTGFTAS